MVIYIYIYLVASHPIRFFLPQDTHMKTAVGLSLAKAAYAANAVCAEVAAAAEWQAPGGTWAAGSSESHRL